MAKRNRPASPANESALEQQIVAFAEQVGWVLGAAQAKTEGWLEQGNLAERLTRIRDGASDLLAQLQGASPAPQSPRLRATSRQPAASSRVASGVMASEDRVHARGKKHRGPVPDAAAKTATTPQQPARRREAPPRRTGRRG